MPVPGSRSRSSSPHVHRTGRMVSLLLTPISVTPLILGMLRCASRREAPTFARVKRPLSGQTFSHGFIKPAPKISVSVANICYS
ncbi:hypothetical protein PHLGIDRAFT_416134 [Phlebiopsis gigantea 11061_1 CR5-6]|uniref:Uncharacterized protein n=1 Tax=Phlebiopsis gigantea (strain 11061_1 CR5-6) TaxID=745531 RepID=A0A0C3S8L5_PHLG1|nr:hypothetical protein PHLGIDRAFT_416134 [Phlebiopsis gigantea 11061_1 CR5-6]